MLVIIIKSCFNQTDSEYLDHLDYLLDKHEAYKTHGISLLGESLIYNCLKIICRLANQNNCENYKWLSH